MTASAIDRVPVESSNLASVGYDADTQTLAVEFRNGRVYEYDGVPPDLVAALLQASSLGSYFANTIRAQYAGRRVG